MFLRHILVYKKALFVIFVYYIENAVHCNKDCYKRYDADQLFDVMHKIDEQYGDVKYTMEGMIKQTDLTVLSSIIQTEAIRVRKYEEMLSDLHPPYEGLEGESLSFLNFPVVYMQILACIPNFSPLALQEVPFFMLMISVSQYEIDVFQQKKILDHYGRAMREDFKVLNNGTQIPTGINLGGYSMLRLPKSLLFFHRMMLHEHQGSKFRLTSLKTCMFNLQIQAHMKLYDLHLFGSYDYAKILNKPGIISYEPTFGQVELLLKNVSYKIDARTRFLKQKLFVELIVSEIDIDEVLMEYGQKESSHSVSLQRKTIDAFIDRLKVDLDKWMKDYLNDIILSYVADFPKNARYEEYHHKRTTALNQYADKVIEKFRDRLNETNTTFIHLPPYEIHSMDFANLSLSEGMLRGLDSIYRRSIATGVKHDDSDVYNINTVVGFSNLKLIYVLNAVLISLEKPVRGFLVLTVDDLTARMDLSLTKHPETVDLSFTFLEQTKPEYLSIETTVSEHMSNFKYILERHIISLLTGNLMESIRKLGTLDRCDPH